MHDINIPVPQAFRDLLELAQGMDAFQDDPRMSAVLRACEAILEAEPTDPCQDMVDDELPCNPFRVYPGALEGAEVSLDGRTIKIALHTSDPKPANGKE